MEYHHKIETPPNLRRGVCCGSCKYMAWDLSEDSFCGFYGKRVSPSQICDSWVGKDRRLQPKDDCK